MQRPSARRSAGPGATGGECLRAVHVSLAFDPVTDGNDLIDRYSMLTGLCTAQARAGLDVHVVQRFWRDQSLERAGVHCHVVADRPRARRPHPLDPLWRVGRTVRDLAPDIVHLHGLAFPVPCAALRGRVGHRAALIVQDHGNVPARRFPRRWLERWLFRWADAFLFTAEHTADPWRHCGAIAPGQVVYEVVESATELVPISRAEARAVTGVTGDPVVLWVGRLHSRKDPVTAVEGFARALEHVPGATLWMLFREADELARIDEVRRRSPRLAERIHLVGPVSRDRMAAWFSAADLFLTSSPAEGSNYALIEAITCGLFPVCSDIPAHRKVTGGGAVARSFAVGSAEGCAAALIDAAARVRAGHAGLGEALRAHAASHLSWSAIAEQSIQAYLHALARRRERRE